MAITEYYVDPVSGSDSNNGLSHATAWATLAYAKANYFRHSASGTGDRINICSSGTCTLSAPVAFASTLIAPTIIQGYTSVAGDGGIGVIDGGNVSALFTNATTSGMSFRDLDMGNCGSATIIDLGSGNMRMENCYLHDTTGIAIGGQGGMITNCRFENIGFSAMSGAQWWVYGCFFADHLTDPTKQSIRFIQSNGQAYITGNIFVKRGDDNQCIFLLGSTSAHMVTNNSFLHLGKVPGGNVTYSINVPVEVTYIFDNLFDGADLAVSMDAIGSNNMVIGNSYFDCEAGISSTGGNYIIYRNTDLTASPFAKVGSPTYANRLNYFQPVNVGDVFSPFGSNCAARGAVQVIPGGTSLLANVFNYPMQDNLATADIDDTSAENNNATLSASTTTAKRTTGPNTRVPFGLDFAVVYATFSEFSLTGLAPYSLTFWGKRPSTGAADVVIGHSAGDSSITFGTAAHTLSVSDQSGNAIGLTLSVDTTLWNHYGVISTAAGIDIYVNGALDDTIDPLPEQLLLDQIAKAASTTGRLKLANLKLYNYELTPAQVLSDFNEDVT